MSVKKILKRLWVRGDTPENFKMYAVLDGARNEAINQLLDSSPRQHHCLYFEPLTESLRLAAPKLVELAQDDFSQQLLEQGWGGSWGVFVRTSTRTPLNQLRHHLRKLNFVEGPQGEHLLFRYYDPRVLRTWLPTCQHADLDIFFGVMTDIFIESEEGSSLLHFHHSARGSTKTEYALC